MVVISLFWQQLLIGMALTAAVIYVILYYVRKAKKPSRCSSCPTLRTLTRSQNAGTRKKYPV